MYDGGKLGVHVHGTRESPPPSELPCTALRSCQYPHNHRTFHGVTVRFQCGVIRFSVVWTAVRVIQTNQSVMETDRNVV